ncbi:GNAT family N-acetyltransferase [Flavilitoribacter nigricans]|uniref:GNAT family N-acetyltransferase n=1 Tax=Flavilitoribacter nigricans (strain ATCC 23147 / DSM 23189 / NBRC 102662 / NCIMB 1420 / SS-2) TaxID=1122177 RepID=A0A2D0NIC7_FLAN2|nr:GNAT family N-acetyltransferase [Flavilitoribacter nigricans]PHN08207.1 GNAT family N-acetyltransferase [Flavilitoribacter nigricans DSM 23189 = NBRC 102662]
MIDTIDENFNRHARQVPERTPGMIVNELPGLTYVDSGLSCDTFNILHISNGSALSAATLEAAVTYYRSRGLDYCIWIGREQLTAEVGGFLQQAGVSRQNEEVGMILDLGDYAIRRHPDHRNVRIADQPDRIADYARVLAHNWTPPDQNVVRFYARTAPVYLASDSDIRLLVYYQEGKPVATLELFPSDAETVGIYGFATLQDFRGRGIGSTLFTFALNYARSAGYRRVILQASEDGLGIYKKYGFKAVTTYYEYA